jgi:hypothetical protein
MTGGRRQLSTALGVIRQRTAPLEAPAGMRVRSRYQPWVSVLRPSKKRIGPVRDSTVSRRRGSSAAAVKTGPPARGLAETAEAPPCVGPLGWRGKTPSAEVIGFAEIGRGEDLQVEAGPAAELRGQGLVEVDRDQERLAVGLDADAIGEVRLLEAERNLGPVGGPVDDALAGGGKQAPLAGDRLEAEVAEGSDALAVLDDLESALTALGVIVVEDEDRDAGPLEILQVVEDPGGGGLGGAGRRTTRRRRRGRGGYRAQGENKGESDNGRDSFHGRTPQPEYTQNRGDNAIDNLAGFSTDANRCDHHLRIPARELRRDVAEAEGVPCLGPGENDGTFRSP